jgi:precorrin-4/cobalt-precorrin-4 C11-methyltransferase
MTVHVYFIGAGPGDPELLTIKARKIIEQADVVIYADSLVNPEILSYARENAEIHGSASLCLEEITGIIIDAVKQGKLVARLQSGDPGIYGAIQEQMEVLDKNGIEYEIIPGVSSLFAAAAALKKELTVPDRSQTVIITRMEGRTPVPDSESIKSLAAHGSSIAIFLSISMIDKVVAELLAGGYSPDTPAAMVYRVGWPDQRLLRTDLKDIVADVKEAGIKKHALILVGNFLDTGNKELHSRLYDREFKHEYR